jgi:hypothetical protein
MLTLGGATSMARRLQGWRRIAPVMVGIYYACMIPIQIIFFIIPKGSPSVTILAFWGLPWALLGWTIWSVARTPNAIHWSPTELIS